MKDKDIWSALSAYVSRGETATEILEKLYLELGPYGGHKVSEETLKLMREFFRFNDSE